jgi:hypothetical protein
MLYPVMPESSQNIYGQIGLSGDGVELDPAELKWGELQPGTAIGVTEAVFPRIEKSKVMSEITEKSEARNQESEPPTSPGDETGVSSPTVREGASAQPDNFITIDDFIKVNSASARSRSPNACRMG